MKEQTGDSILPPKYSYLVPCEIPYGIVHGIPAASPRRRSCSHGFLAFRVHDAWHHIWHLKGLIQSPLISSLCPELGPEWAHSYSPSLLQPAFHTCPALQPAYKWQTAACNINIWPQNECDLSSLSPQKKFWYFHFIYKQNQHIIYVCEQSDFMVFLFVDRMIGIKLHSVDKKCDEMSLVNIMNKRVWQNAVCQWDVVKVLTKWILSVCYLS